MMAWAISLSTRWMPLLGKPWHTAPKITVSRTGTESLYSLFKIITRHDKTSASHFLPLQIEIIALSPFFLYLSFFESSMFEPARSAQLDWRETRLLRPWPALTLDLYRLAWPNLSKQLFPTHDKLMLVGHHASATRELVYTILEHLLFIIQCISML